MHSVTIIGIGRVGRALAVSLVRAGYRIDALIVRDGTPEAGSSAELPPELFVPASFATSIASDIVFICTQDHEISGAVRMLVSMARRGMAVFHTSGALSSEVLAPLADVGAHTGSIHPLISISERAVTDPFHGAYFCVEGDAAAEAIGKTIAADLGGIPFSIETSKKAAYHAAAVMACGHLVALADAAFSLMEQCGPDAEFSRRLLLPLVSSTIANISAQSTSQALTGPFARTDVDTIERHLKVLEQSTDPELLQIYTALGLRSLDLAIEQGADKGRAASIRERLLMAERGVR